MSQNISKMLQFMENSRIIRILENSEISRWNFQGCTVISFLVTRLPPKNKNRFFQKLSLFFLDASKTTYLEFSILTSQKYQLDSLFDKKRC